MIQAQCHHLVHAQFPSPSVPPFAVAILLLTTLCGPGRKPERYSKSRRPLGSTHSFLYTFFALSSVFILRIPHMATVIVDDSDLSQLTYAGQWTKGGSGGEYNRYVWHQVVLSMQASNLLGSTTHGSTTKGSTIKFKFNGMSQGAEGWEVSEHLLRHICVCFRYS